MALSDQLMTLANSLKATIVLGTREQWHAWEAIDKSSRYIFNAFSWLASHAEHQKPNPARGRITSEQLAQSIEASVEADQPIVTKTGKVLTDADVQALADEAERGYETPLQERLAQIAGVSLEELSKISPLPPPTSRPRRQSHEPGCESLYGDYHCTCQ